VGERFAAVPKKKSKGGVRASHRGHFGQGICERVDKRLQVKGNKVKDGQSARKKKEIDVHDAGPIRKDAGISTSGTWREQGKRGDEKKGRNEKQLRVSLRNLKKAKV